MRSGLSNTDKLAILARTGEKGASTQQTPKPAQKSRVEGQEGMEGAICLVLPYPPSANRYWRHSKHGVYVSKEAEDYKYLVAQQGLIHNAKPFEGEVAMLVHVYRPQRRGDLLNRSKILEDALQGVTFLDDSQIVEAHYYRHDDKTDPRVEVQVSAFVPLEGVVQK